MMLSAATRTDSSSRLSVAVSCASPTVARSSASTCRLRSRRRPASMWRQPRSRSMLSPNRPLSARRLCMISASAACGSPRSPTSTRSRFPTTSHVSRESWSRTASAAVTRPRVAWASVPGRASSTMSERSSSPGAARRIGPSSPVNPGCVAVTRVVGRQQDAQRRHAGLARRRLELVAPVQDDPQEPRDRLRALRVAPEPPEVLRDARGDERAGTEPRGGRPALQPEARRALGLGREDPGVLAHRAGRRGDAPAAAVGCDAGQPAGHDDVRGAARDGEARAARCAAARCRRR